MIFETKETFYEFQDFITSFNQRLSAEFFSMEFISQDDLEKLGKNDPEE